MQHYQIKIFAAPLTLRRYLPRRLTGYLFREWLSFFLLCLGAFTGVLFTLRVLNFSELIINKGVDTSQIALVFLSIVPTFLEFAIPLSALLGVMLAGARLSGDSELVVLRASGISIYQLLYPLGIFSTFVFILSLAVSFTLKPWGHQTLSDALFDIARTKSTAGLEAGTFNRVGALTLYAEKIDNKKGALTGVMIDDRRGNDQRKVIFAEKGQILSRPSTRTIIFSLQNGSIHEMIGGNYLATQFVTNSIFLGADELYNPDAKVRGKVPRELTINQLRVATKQLSAAEALMEREGQTIRPIDSFDPEVQKHFTESAISSAQLTKKRRRLQVEIDQRYSMPFATAILTLLALPLGIHPPRAQRSWGVGLSVVVGIGVFVSYYGLLSLGLTLVESELVSSSVGVWIPNIVTALIAFWLVHEVGSERVSSIAELPPMIKRQLRSLQRSLKSLISPSHEAS